MHRPPSWRFRHNFIKQFTLFSGLIKLPFPGRGLARVGTIAIVVFRPGARLIAGGRARWILPIGGMAETGWMQPCLLPALKGSGLRSASSSTDRVTDFESEGCRFESCLAQSTICLDSVSRWDRQVDPNTDGLKRVCHGAVKAFRLRELEFQLLGLDSCRLELIR
jgi:hypothetical protein